MTYAIQIGRLYAYYDKKSLEKLFPSTEHRLCYYPYPIYENYVYWGAKILIQKVIWYFYHSKTNIGRSDCNSSY